MVKRLMRKYGTTNPYRLTKELNIIVLYEDLGTINGYYNKCYRQKFIHINQNLSEDMQYYVLCHELGHAVLHPDVNISFFTNNSIDLTKSRIEKEADAFAFEIIQANADIG